MIVAFSLAFILLVTVVLVTIALTTHTRSDLAGTVPESNALLTSPTPSRTPSPTPTPAAAPTPTPTPTPGPLPVVEGAPVQTTGYVQFSDSIPFGYVTQEDPSQPTGVSYVSVEGSEGTVLTTVEIIYLDGEETSRSVVSEEVTVAPVDQVTVVGTGTVTPEEPAPSDPAPADPPAVSPTSPPVPAPEG
jgi:hypothetical protein